jgi:GntR family transcriptional repressor for pyruvate dehydrogenase complex
MLNGVSTGRPRSGNGVIEAGAPERTISEHAGILAARRARDPGLAEAAALLHVSTTETWFRTVLNTQDPQA